MERVMTELASFFCLTIGLEVHMVLYGRNPEIFYEVPFNLHIHKPLSTSICRIRFFLIVERLIFLRKTVKRINPKTVLSFGEYWNSFVLLALHGLPYPIYISDRCSPEKNFQFFHALLRKWLYPRAAGIIAQTETAKGMYLKQFSQKNIAVIGNPILQIGIGTKREKVVLSVGRLIKSKNHDKLIEIFCDIAKPDWKLIIVGGDALKQDNRERLSELISKLNAEGKVIITGYQSNVRELYQQGAIFAFPSVSEGFPNVIGEAMSAALPVVAFDCIAGPSEMIRNEENGFLVTLNDYDTFRKRLEQLMSDDSLRIKLGLKAMESIKEYSVERIGYKYFYFMFGS